MTDNAIVQSISSSVVAYPDTESTVLVSNSAQVLVVEIDDTDVLSAQEVQIVSLAVPQISVIRPPGENIQVVAASSTNFLTVDNTVTQVVGLNIATVPTLDPDTPARNWIDYVANWRANTIPVKISTIAAGDVYRYTFANGDLLYRLVGSEPYTDGFYQNWDGSAVSGLVLNRAMNI